MFSFPKTISETQQYKQFGNSVCIPVIEELAKYINNILENTIGRVNNGKEREKI